MRKFISYILLVSIFLQSTAGYSSSSSDPETIAKDLFPLEWPDIASTLCQTPRLTKAHLSEADGTVLRVEGIEGVLQMSDVTRANLLAGMSECEDHLPIAALPCGKMPYYDANTGTFKYVYEVFDCTSVPLTDNPDNENRFIYFTILPESPVNRLFDQSRLLLTNSPAFKNESSNTLSLPIIIPSSSLYHERFECFFFTPSEDNHLSYASFCALDYPKNNYQPHHPIYTSEKIRSLASIMMNLLNEYYTQRWRDHSWCDGLQGMLEVISNEYSLLGAAGQNALKNIFPFLKVVKMLCKVQLLYEPGTGKLNKKIVEDFISEILPSFDASAKSSPVFGMLHYYCRLVLMRAGVDISPRSDGEDRSDEISFHLNMFCKSAYMIIKDQISSPSRELSTIALNVISDILATIPVTLWEKSSCISVLNLLDILTIHPQINFPQYKNILRRSRAFLIRLQTFLPRTLCLEDTIPADSFTHVALRSDLFEAHSNLLEDPTSTFEARVISLLKIANINIYAITKNSLAETRAKSKAPLYFMERHAFFDSTSIKIICLEMFTTLYSKAIITEIRDAYYFPYELLDQLSLDEAEMVSDFVYRISAITHNGESQRRDYANFHLQTFSHSVHSSSLTVFLENLKTLLETNETIIKHRIPHDDIITFMQYNPMTEANENTLGELHAIADNPLPKELNNNPHVRLFIARSYHRRGLYEQAIAVYPAAMNSKELAESMKDALEGELNECFNGFQELVKSGKAAYTPRIKNIYIELLNKIKKNPRQNSSMKMHAIFSLWENSFTDLACEKACKKLEDELGRIVVTTHDDEAEKASFMRQIEALKARRSNPAAAAAMVITAEPEAAAKTIIDALVATQMQPLVDSNTEQRSPSGKKKKKNRNKKNAKATVADTPSTPSRAVENAADLLDTRGRLTQRDVQQVMNGLRDEIKQLGGTVPADLAYDGFHNQHQGPGGEFVKPGTKHAALKQVDRLYQEVQRQQAELTQSSNNPDAGSAAGLSQYEYLQQTYRELNFELAKNFIQEIGKMQNLLHMIKRILADQPDREQEFLLTIAEAEDHLNVLLVFVRGEGKDAFNEQFTRHKAITFDPATAALQLSNEQIAELRQYALALLEPQHASSAGSPADRATEIEHHRMLIDSLRTTKKQLRNQVIREEINKTKAAVIAATNALANHKTELAEAISAVTKIVNKLTKWYRGLQNEYNEHLATFELARVDPAPLLEKLGRHLHEINAAIPLEYVSPEIIAEIFQTQVPREETETAVDSNHTMLIAEYMKHGAGDKCDTCYASRLLIVERVIGQLANVLNHLSTGNIDLERASTLQLGWMDKLIYELEKVSAADEAFKSSLRRGTRDINALTVELEAFRQSHAISTVAGGFELDPRLLESALIALLGE